MARRLDTPVLVFILLAAGCAAGPAPRAGDYRDLVALFQDWRSFERPPMRDGAPDYQTRVDRLDRCVAMVVENQDALCNAISQDFGNATKQNFAVQIANPEVSKKPPTHDGAYTAGAVIQYRQGLTPEPTAEKTTD